MTAGLDGGAEQTQHPRYVVVTGAVGAGASTLSKVLIDRLGWEPFLEGAVEEDNQFFVDAYSDFSRWGFHSQVHFLMNSARRHRRLSARLALSTRQTIVEDRTPFEHTGAYLGAYEALNRITSREARLLRDVTEQIERFYVVPDLLVYREMTPDQMLSRVEQRGRTGEGAADFGLLDAIRHSFDEFVTEWDRSPKVIVSAEVDVLDPIALDPVVSAVARAVAAH